MYIYFTSPVLDHLAEPIYHRHTHSLSHHQTQQQQPQPTNKLDLLVLKSVALVLSLVNFIHRHPETTLPAYSTTLIHIHHKMQSSTFITAIIMALASYAVAAPVPDVDGAETIVSPPPGSCLYSSSRPILPLPSFVQYTAHCHTSSFLIPTCFAN